MIYTDRSVFIKLSEPMRRAAFSARWYIEGGGGGGSIMMRKRREGGENILENGQESCVILRLYRRFARGYVCAEVEFRVYDGKYMGMRVFTAGICICR